MASAKQLKSITDGLMVLYVEDNHSLRVNAAKLLGKFFDRVDVAEDGQIGLELYKKNRYDIVISDIKMPNMDGITLLKNIKALRFDTKTILLTAFDDKEYLYKAIELGVFRYIKKPVDLPIFIDVLYEAVGEIKEQRDSKLFYMHLKSIFNYQSSMVLMLHDSVPTIANNIFLEFFECETIAEFTQKVKNFFEEFMQHDGFLYKHDDVEPLATLRKNEKKLFHVKMKTLQGEIRHLILKFQKIPEKDGYEILSFDDITELNLLKLFDASQTLQDETIQNSQSMLDLLRVLQRNSAKIELHNYYKGLSITNDGVITDVQSDGIVIKTNYLQQKAIQFEGKTLIVSQTLPNTIESLNVPKMSFEKQNVLLKDLHFVKTSPITRSTIRVVPEEKHTVSLFLGENKFHGDVSIEDISLDGVKLTLNALPPGLEKGSDVVIDMVLELDKRPLIINIKATMYRKSETRYNFSVVFIFQESKKKELVAYITKRQMAIIREFKGLQNG